MARIDALPSIDIIRGFKGILDFYLWRGLPCVRAWPRWRPARQSDASRAAALLFGAIIKAFSLTHGAVRDQLAIEATGVPRTPRDIYVSGVFGNLHEASMSDFLTLLTECRDFLSDLTALLNALDSIDTDELVVNVDQSVLPAGAATAAAQATQLTALQKIDDLQDALESNALDRLLVRGMDQLFSFKAVLGTGAHDFISGNNGYLDSLPCAAGQIFCVTSIASKLLDRATTIHEYRLLHNAVSFRFGETRKAIAADQWVFWQGWKWIDPADVIRVYFTGGIAGDECWVILTGFNMTLET